MARALATFLTFAGLTFAALALAGCTSAEVPEPEWAPVVPVASEPVPATPGAIWRAGGGGLVLFGDEKARNPGDLLTIVLSEQTQASSSASTKIKKDDNASISVPFLGGAPVTFKGNDILANELAAAREFNGEGDTSQSNELSGNITVTVVARLANGNLLVRGEKKLRLNQGDESVRIEGVVRLADIAPDNTVPSARVADARISYSGRGSLGDANKRGWLSRFLSSRWMPF